MNEKKLICTDLDGTILFRKENENGEKEVYMNDGDKKSLVRLQQEGHAIAVVTGREKQGIRSFLQNAHVAFDYYVGTNGSLIMDEHFEIIQRKEIPGNIVYELLNFMKVNHPEVNMMATTGTEMYFINGTYQNAQVQRHDNAKELTYDEYDPKKQKLVMLNVHAPDEYLEDREKKIATIEAELLKKFDGRLNIFRNNDFVDIVLEGNSKGAAVKKIANMLDISLENVYTIGDSWNDLSMLELPEVSSYTFSYASPELQRIAKKTVDSFEEMTKDIF